MFRLLQIIVILSAAAAQPTAGLHAQVKLSIGTTVGYASFSMKDLKAYQSERLLQYDIPIAVVDEFPGYLNYGINFTVNTRAGLFEAFLGHTSTGGRIHYGDYSGYVSEELLARMNYIGMMAATRIFRIKSANVFLGIQALNYFNTLKIKNDGAIYAAGAGNQYSYTVSSMNIAFAPVLEVQHQVKKFLLKSSISYEKHICGKLAYDENGNHTLKNYAGEDVKMDPSGLRLNLGIGYILKR